MILLLKGTVSVAVVAALTDPQWAVTLNTALLVILAFLNVRHERSVSAARKDSADAARVAKEVGGLIRDAAGQDTPTVVLHPVSRKPGTDGTHGTGLPEVPR